MSKYIAPTYFSEAFNCPRCDVLAPQKWYVVTRGVEGELMIESAEERALTGRAIAFLGNKQHKHREAWELDLTICDYCSKYTIWENRKVIFPYKIFDLPDAHVDMPEDVKQIYTEARLIYKHSPRASAALLRLAIETLIPQLNDYSIKKDTLNKMISELVKKDIPEHIQQGFDLIRVYGNEGIHPGQIVIEETQDMVIYLFNLTNDIVEELIARKQKINEAYSSLPKGKLEEIIRRNVRAKQSN
ncbi:DUF4145 domain-containing protein [Cytobacillus horneckiae]